MEWNSKWDWENLAMFNSKSMESYKKLQLQPTDWGIEEEGGDIDAISSFNTSGSGGGSGSDLGLGSSSFTKSSITASTDDSSLKEGIKTSNFTFEAFECSAEDFNKKNEFTRAGQTGNSPTMEASVVSGEQLIGLKLGKRTYFENNYTVKNSSFSVVPVSSSSVNKRIRSSGQTTMPLPRCLVEGCNLDLSSAKGYHKKHKVCATHSKCPKVIVGGLERRFCQQCSRFHNLSEFDEKKRSCRRRLSDHNARRRKPQQEEIQFKPTGLSSPFYDGREQLNFELQNYPLVHTEPVPNPTWTSTHAINIFSHDSSRLLPCSKGTRAEVFNQDLKDSKFSYNFDAAPDHHRALSLLSINARGSQPEPVIYNHHMHVNHYSMHQPTMHAVPQGLPIASSAYWLTEQRPSDSHALNANIERANHLQETQMFKMPYVSSFNANPSN